MGEYNKPPRRIPITAYPLAFGTAYEAGDTVYVYNKRPLKHVGEAVRRALELPPYKPELRDQTESLRQWADEYNLSVPKDTEQLHHYVITVGEAESPTCWPTLKYMETHTYLALGILNSYRPTVVYPHGTHYMCRFGHEKRTADGKIATNCYRCSWWRHQGIDLGNFKPTHCLKGHPLKDNRWLVYHHHNGRDYVTEKCIICNNNEVMKLSGYEPHE
jgi:hypothetical protein